MKMTFVEKTFLYRQVLDKIQGLVVPKRFKENVDLATLIIRSAQKYNPEKFIVIQRYIAKNLNFRSKPYNDNEELLSMCYRCSTTNPLFNPKGNRCTNCHQV